MSLRFFMAPALAGLLSLATIMLATPTRAQSAKAAGSLEELRAQIEQHIRQPRFDGALWGIKIASLATGKTIFESHADRLMSPASNSKLYAAALALDTLGGDYQFVTPILATAKTDPAGVLRGDLIISGRGDPSWKATNFWDNFTPFIEVLAKAGVRRVTGDLIADNTFFKAPMAGSGWCAEDLEDSEGAEISALTLADNTIQMVITPDKTLAAPGQTTPLPPETGLVFINRTTTIAAGGKKHLEVRKPLGAKVIYILGEIPAGTPPEILDIPVPQPGAWFGAALKTALARQGISVWGKVRCIAWPELAPWPQGGLIKLGEVKSPPLRSLIRAFMKPSQNLETDLVFDHTGEVLRAKEAPPWQTSEQAAVAALETWLAAKDIPADLHFDEGSGLSRNNLTSANATVALLSRMTTNRWAQDYFEALPIAGVDGTLRRRMKNTPAYQNVHAKTGTLRWVNALSGYVTTAAGERLVFSLMLNRYEPPADRKRTDELDAIAVRLAGFTGHTND